MTSLLRKIKPLGLILGLAIGIFFASSCWDDDSSFTAIGLILSFWAGWRYGKLVGVVSSGLATLLLILAFHFDNGFTFSELSILETFDYSPCYPSTIDFVHFVLLLIFLPIIASYLRPTFMTSLSNLGYRIRHRERPQTAILMEFFGDSIVVNSYQWLDSWLKTVSRRNAGKIVVMILAYLFFQFLALAFEYEEWSGYFYVSPSFESAAFIVVALFLGRSFVPVLAVLSLGLLLVSEAVFDYYVFDARYNPIIILQTSIAAWVLAGFGDKLEKVKDSSLNTPSTHLWVSFWLLPLLLPLLFTYNIESQIETEVLASGRRVSLFPIMAILLSFRYKISGAALSNTVLLGSTIAAILSPNILAGVKSLALNLTFFDVALLSLMPLWASRIDLSDKANARSLIYVSIFGWAICPLIYGGNPRWIFDGFLNSTLLLVALHLVIAELIAFGYVWINKRGTMHEY